VFVNEAVELLLGALLEIKIGHSFLGVLIATKEAPVFRHSLIQAHGGKYLLEFPSIK
jgi:hypothetical protein